MHTFDSESKIRAYWNERAERIEGDENIADFLALLRIVDNVTFQIALPSLCIVASKNISAVRKYELETMCANVLLDSESTRPSRRAAIACLKEFCSGPLWNSFFTLIEALEEPQFHIIRPVLPRFDSILQAVRKDNQDFVWLKIVLFRAILHTNGWVRVWAIEKCVSIDFSILKDNYQFITSIVIPNINNNDVFWRQLEKGRMDEFLSDLGSIFNAIKNAPEFMRHLLSSIELLSCPTAMYFVVSALNKVMICEILNSDDVVLMRKVVLKARYIPHKSMRVTTIRNLIIFYAKITRLSAAVLEELTNLIGYFSSDVTEKMVESTFHEIEKIIILTKYKFTEERNGINLRERFKNDVKNLELHSKMWWISLCRETQLEEKVMSRLNLEVSELLGEKPSPDLTTELYLLKEIPKRLEDDCDVLEFMKNVLGEYILTQIVSNKGSKREFQLVDSLYIPLFTKYCLHLCTTFAMAVIQILGDLETCESTALCLIFFNALVERAPEEHFDVISEAYLKYLGDNIFIGMKRMKKSVDEYDAKEFNQITARLHSLRIALLNKFIKSVDVNTFLIECIEQLDVASAFSVKQEICNLIARFIGPNTDQKIAIDCIRACSSIVNEEKKSLNSLPALKSFVNIVLNGPLSDPEVAKESIEVLEAQLTIANQSTPVALILVDAIRKYRTNLDKNWAPFIVKLALFGPVPKKESRVISFAYSKIYKEAADLMETDQLERLDEVVQKARFKAVLLAVKLSSEDGTAWTVPLIEEIFNASAMLDQSSSRSFGLSMAHRQKTRAVELLHLLSANVEDETLASKIFDFCINCVVDPCQQFSIKLIVEWTLAKLCIKFQNLFKKFIDANFEKNMAEQRIGSMCSWLNVLMLISRTASQLTESCLEKVIVWCTAQNFPVRCTALAAARLMFSTLDKDHRKKWRLVKAIINFASEPSGNSKRVTENLCSDFYFSKLHINNHFDYQTILSHIAKQTGMPHEETIPNNIIGELNDSTGVKSFNSDSEFLAAPSEVYSALSKNSSCAPNMEDDDSPNDSKNTDYSTTDDESVSPFQRKIIKKDEVKHDEISLIVVATLVDKPNNLGGICRTCEVFGVDTLVVSDVLVAQDSNFKALSMSSENWQRIEGVKSADLLGYLQNLRSNGYTVIAAEQTTDSVMMHDFVFPKKAVIVMGDEKEGVPVNILRAVDQTVEIKQVGHTRSLNVHVTAALMIAKFAEQVRFAN